jgi:Transposase IS66 family
MNSEDIPHSIPNEFESNIWIRKLVVQLQEQSRQIQDQSRQIQDQSQQIQEQFRQIQEQSEEIVALKKTVQEQRDEINRLKNLPKRPNFRSGGGNSKDRSGKPNINKGQNGSPLSDLVPKKIRQEVIIEASNVPAGSRFKGYQEYTIQELELVPKDVIYKLKVWQAPDGTIIRATLPKEAQGSHFGYQLRALVHTLYALGMTEPGLFEFLIASGIDISEGQVHHIFMNEAIRYQQASEEILSAGIEEASYIRVDDTGAKHLHKNSYCTHIGGKYFAYYKTTSNKSRENFLNLLLQGKEGYIINEAFMWHLFQCGVEDAILNLFEEYVGKRYETKKGIHRFLNSLRIENKKLRLQCIEAGLVGFISETILKPGQVLLSDRAGQFAVFNHAGCWVHLERPLRKLETSTLEVEKELAQVRKAIWDLYDKVKEASCTQMGKEEVHKLYDQLVEMRSVSPKINEVIATFAKYREEMLKALDHPNLPLHNNDSERDIRGVAKRRNISGSTKSEDGKIFRDSIMTLKQTCSRLGISFIGYLKSWFKREVSNLAEIVRERYRKPAQA